MGNLGLTLFIPVSDATPIIVSDEIFWNLDIVRTIDNPTDAAVSCNSGFLDVRAGLLVSFVASSAYGDESHVSLVIGIGDHLHEAQIGVDELFFIWGFQLVVVIVAAQVDHEHVGYPLFKIPDGLLTVVSG